MIETRYRIEVLVHATGGIAEWLPLRQDPKSEPYGYDTREEAERMMRICYPDQLREHRLGGLETVRVREQ